MIISPYYRTYELLAQAWQDARREIEPGKPPKTESLIRQLYRDGSKYRADTVPGTSTFKPDTGEGFAQAPAEWVKTPESILALNEILSKLKKVE